MSDNVVHLGMDTKLDVPVEKVLEGAKAYDLQQAMVIGADREGRLMIFQSTGDTSINNLLLDCAKVEILNSQVIRTPMLPKPMTPPEATPVLTDRVRYGSSRVLWNDKPYVHDDRQGWRNAETGAPPPADVLADLNGWLLTMRRYQTYALHEDGRVTVVPEDHK